jgi:hypothetical protein
VPDLGENITFTLPDPDTDGDGTPDTIITGDYLGVAVQRGDGEVKLRPGDEHDSIYLGGYGPQPGDLDGDGRDDLVIGVDQEGEQYLLPGTTDPGTHQIADVGISLDGFRNTMRPVGDQDGDGADDLAFPSGPVGDDQWSVYSGADLMAPGPGGAATPGTPIATYEGTDLAAAVLEPGQSPTILTGEITDPTAPTISVTVYTDPSVALVASGVSTEYTGGIGRLEAWNRDGQILVSASASDRSGASLTVWNLTDPCSRFLNAPAAPTAPAAPAAPVQSQARYTG